MEHKLIELINIDKSKILIENFSKVVGMPMALLDMQGNVLIGENRCSVHKKFYSKSKDAGKKCDDFHNSMVEKLKNLDDYIVYKCCHNLMNAVIPICIKNTQVANLIVAEFFHEKPDMEFYMTEAKKYGLDEEKYLKFISSIPVISKKETNHIVDFVLSLANILAGLVLQRMQVIQEAEAHKQTQKEAHKSQTLFRALFRGAAEGILIANVETKKFKYANPTICKMLGYTEEELIIKNVSDIHPKNKLKHVIEEFEAQARGEKVCAPNIPCLRKDGSIVYADIYTSPISIGGREYNVGFFADITERKAAEKEIYNSQQALLEAQKIAHFGNWIYNYNTNKLYWSDELFNIYGIEKQDINLEFMVSIMHPDDKKFGLKILNTFIKGEVDNFELGFRVICLDGIMRHIYSKGKLIFDEHSKPIKAMGIVQDITELKQAEIMSHLQRDLAYELSSINNVQTALDVLLKATMKIEYIDGGGVYIVNEETGELDLISHIGLSDKFIKNVLHYPSDAPNTKMIMQGKAIYSSVINLPPEVQPVLKKEKLRAMAIVPVMYENKTVAALNLASRTIDEIPQNERDIIESISTQIGTIMVRIKAEEALRISERRFREIIEKSNDAICVIQDLDFVLINPKCTELFEYTEEEALSSNYEILDVIDEESKKFVQIIIDRRDEEDYFPLHFQFKAKSKSGKKIDCDVTISEIEWDNKKAVLCFVRDMTLQNRLEAQLQQAQKMETIGRLAGGIAHDFNNLLTAIIGNAELGMLDLNENDPLYDEFNDIMKTASRAANLTRQLLAFGRRQVLSPKIIDLNKIVIDMDKMLRRIIGTDIRFSTMTSKSIWNIKADASQIEQIVVNLVVNARDAMENGGDLSIETKNIVVDDKFYKIYNFTDIPHGQYAMISITDTGKGIEEQLLENVFEPFFTTKKLGAGTGLGLATVYGIVKQSRGYIQVNSKIGKGTSFKVYFPAQKDQQVEPITKNKLSNNLSGNETVLIVEDNDAVRQIAIRVLKNYGYDVLDASNAEDAITLCKNFNKKISIVVTDIVMPEINGIQMIKLLREIKDDFKVLYVSGYTKSVVTEEGLLKSGANYLQKPFKPHQLAKAIRDILNR